MTTVKSITQKKRKHEKDCCKEKKRKKKQNLTRMGKKMNDAELLITGFMAEHGMSFSQAHHLIPVIKEIFPYCVTARNATLMETRAAYVPQYGIAWEESRDTPTVRHDIMCSLLTDESTDI